MNKAFFSILFLLLCSAGQAQASRSEEQSSKEPANIVSPLLMPPEEFDGLPSNPGPDTQTSAVYGKDNRFFLPTGYPWRAIGKLFIGKSSFCTATLINQCYLLTASHCVTDEDGAYFDANQMQFHGSNDGPSSGIESFLYGKRNIGKRYDWAIVKLKSNLGDKLGWFGVDNIAGSSIANDFLFTLAGYSSDLGDGGKRATVDNAVRIKFYHQGAPNFIYHNANSAPGSSGAAIFYKDKKGNARIVAVNTRAILGPNKKQVYYTSDSDDPDQLANGVATNQFFGEMLQYMKQHPCK